MTLWRLAQLLVVVLVSIQTAQATFYNESDATEWNVTTAGHRRLASGAPGNVAACYTPFHNNEYPLFGGSLNLDALRSAIEDDFRVMSKYFTHVRTYYAQHFGIEIAPIAAKYGLKLYLGAYLTSESWWAAEANAAANAIKNYPGTVEVVFTGNENLADFRERSWDIINKINDIKARAGSAAGNVKYGTVQRINEFVDWRFNWDMQQLNNVLDILGVNIYPFFTNSYDSNKPAALLDAQWNQVTSMFPSDKIRLTETGYPTAGSTPWQAPNVKPGLEASVNYYNGVVNWTPSGYENKPKFWFQAFDRRYGDPGANGVDYELYFGFLTTAKQTKRDGFPRPVQVVAQSGARSATCTIEENVDYSGGDVGNKPATQAESCYAICNSVSGCAAFTWSPFNGGTCWLKSSKGSSHQNNGMRSGVACASPPSITTTACSVEENADFSGADIGSKHASRAESCFGLCNAFSGCDAFTWTTYNDGTCWFKSSKGNAKTSSGARSGVACKCNLGGLEVGVDYSGPDVGNAYGANAEACISQCQGKSGCRAFTWTTFNGGTCWLKSSKGSTKGNGAATSGVIC